MEKRIFRFSGSTVDWTEKDVVLSKKVLGGKGAGLVMMAQAGLPVPPGFTITTDVCNMISDYKSKGHSAGSIVDKLMVDVVANDVWLSEQFGYCPLVSVRSGAPVSMPGMMDTILNVGLTSETMGQWEQRLGKRAAWDSYRRLIQMLGHTAYGVPSEAFEFQLAAVKKEAGVKLDSELLHGHLVSVVERYKNVFLKNMGVQFPNDRYEQLRAAVVAVFDSWMNPRAIEYRKLNKIDENMGTAVTVQSMVFGNMDDASGTGVLFRV